MTPKVLIISYLFPPIGGGGVQRALKMAKYLPQYGWEAHILTVSEDVYFASKDASLLKQLPESAVIHRASQIDLYPRRQAPNSDNAQASAAPKSNNITPKKVNKRAALLRRFLKGIKNRILIPDDQILWYRNAVKVGLAAIRQHQIRAIFSTSGPNTDHLVAYKLHKMTNIPWIADFRDPWTENMHRSGIRWREWLEARMEARVVTQANVITTVTESFLSGFTNKYGAAIRKGVVIHNGYDVEDYQGIEQVAEKKIVDEQIVDKQVMENGSDIVSGDSSDKMHFVYTGIFYEKRNPRLFLQAVHQLIDEGKIQREQIALHFAGIFDYPGQNANWQAVVELGLENQVTLHGQLPHEQALRLLAQADVQLLIADTDPSAGAYIPGKLFEYIAIGKPVLALSHLGESTDILQSLGNGAIANPTDIEDIKRAVYQLYIHWRDTGQAISLPSTLMEQTKKFQRQEHARMLAEELQLLLASESNDLF